MAISSVRGSIAKTLLFVVFILFSATSSLADGIIVQNRQKAFPQSVPAGDYSGITWLGGDRYAVVSDKSANDGFFLFTIDVDSVTGEIHDVKNNGFVECRRGNTDLEGIAWLPDSLHILLCGEKDNTIRAYGIDGSPVDRVISQAKSHSSLPGNKGLESLSYNNVTKRLWTCNESPDIVIAEYDRNFNVAGEYPYVLDAPLKNGAKALVYAHGVSELCALDDGTLLVMEREFYVPKAKIGSSVNCKLFRFFPSESRKELMSQWKTRLNITCRNLANYEGMCLGPSLVNGSQVIIMISDSQSQYKNILKDWFKTVVIR